MDLESNRAGPDKGAPAAVRTIGGGRNRVERVESGGQFEEFSRLVWHAGGCNPVDAKEVVGSVVVRSSAPMTLGPIGHPFSSALYFKCLLSPSMLHLV